MHVTMESLGALEARLGRMSIRSLPAIHKLQSEYHHLNYSAAMRTRLSPLKLMKRMFYDSSAALELMLITNTCILGEVADRFFHPFNDSEYETFIFECCESSGHFKLWCMYLESCGYCLTGITNVNKDRGMKLARKTGLIDVSAYVRRGRSSNPVQGCLLDITAGPRRIITGVQSSLLLMLAGLSTSSLRPS